MFHSNDLRERHNLKSSQYLLLISWICCGLTIGLGVIALLGWLLGQRPWASIGYDYIPMAPNTATAFIAIGAVALVLHRRPLPRIIVRISAIISLCVAMVGILTLLHYFHVIAFDVDLVILKCSGELFGHVSVGYMSPLTAGNFILTSASLLLLTFPTRRKPIRNVASCLAATVVAVGCIVVFGYLYGTPIFYVGTTVPMAINTAFAFVMMGISLIHLTGLECIPANYFTGDSVRARLMCGFFPILVFTSIFTDIMFDMFVVKRFVNPAVAIGINVVLTAVVLGVIVFFIAKMVGGRMDRMEAMRKQAEAVLRESEEKYKTLIEILQDAVFINDGYQITYVNAAALKLFGAENQGQIIGKSPLALFHPDFHSIMKQSIDTMAKQGILAGLIEEKIVRLDGTLVDVEVVATPFVLNDKKAIQVVLRDITARKQAEEKVTKIAESVFDAIVMMDENERITYWNSAAETMFGYTKEEALGKNVFRLLVTEDEAGIFLNGMMKFKANGTLPILGKRVVLPARRKDGTPFYAEHSFASFQSAGSWNAVSVIRDCTEQKRYEDALKKLNETLEQHVAERTKELLTKNDEMRKLTQAVEQSPTCVVITDTRGTIEYVNPRFLELTGYTFNEVIGKNPRVLKSGQTPVGRYNDLWGTITTGKTWQGEFINKKKNGDLYRELVSISPLKNAEGNISGYIAFKSDITEIRTLEEEQEKLKEHLYHSQKLDSVGRLAGGIAHDFNNKLMAIMGYSELAVDEIDEGNPAKDYLRKILECSISARGLTQSLLSFSRRQPVSLSPVCLNSLIKNVECLLLKTLGENISCKLILTDKDIIVLADSDKMEQLLLNLVNNAVDAMPGGGTLTIGTDVVVLDRKSASEHELDKDGAYGTITITDTGMGMDEETKMKIFEPYFTTKERGKGTGLGLPIVYGIVKQHNGHIEIISEPNKGATFKIYLPISEMKAMKPDIDKNKKAIQSVRAKTILVAEDDDGVRALVSRILERAGYHVVSAVNGDDAIEKFEACKDKIDMLLFDVMMPKKGGKDAYNCIKKLMPDIKVLFMSGYSENIVTNKEIGDEGLTFIQKPMSANNLLKKIEELQQET